MRWINGHKAQPNPAYMADMRTQNEDPLDFHSEIIGSKTALKLAEQIAEGPTYQLLAEILPPEKVALYFEKRLKNEILPVIRDLCIAQWHSDNGGSKPHQEIVWRGQRGLGPLLKSQWPSDDIPFKLGPPQRSIPSGRPTLARLYKTARRFSHRVQRTVSGHRALPFPTLSGPTIAAHYAQGVDPTRRSDLFWYPGSQVDPNQVLVFFDNYRAGYTGRRVPDADLQTIEGMGINWVCLGNDVVAHRNPPVWAPSGRPGSLLAQFKRRSPRPASPTEQWVVKESEWLLREVEYWVSFYEEFNIKVHLDVGNGHNRYIAQNIALDLTDGVRIGWQNAELYVAEGAELGAFPNHVRFFWNRSGESHAKRNRSRINSLVISGFPYRGPWDFKPDDQELRDQFAAKGVHFVVAFFDNLYGWDLPYSKSMIQAFYSAFLRWVLEDPQLGVITKSKRPNPLAQMGKLKGLMETAEATGRWINLTDVYGRLPSDASRAADMSVGIGISSAVSEAVAAGGRGIHCDLPSMRAHPFYDWGYEKVVFDSLDRMITSLKRYKGDPASEPELGDFSSMMDQVDPFHDGRGGDRMGDYIRWLLEGFEAGNDRDTAIQRAHEKYANSWGPDKVISFPVPV